MMNANFTTKVNETFAGVLAYSQLNSTVILHDSLFKECKNDFVSPSSDYLRCSPLLVH